MDNRVLENIKVRARNELNTRYGFCAVAETDDFAMLTTTDDDGKDIKITIKVETD